MEIRAAEISAILKEQIANFGTETDVAEVGQVKVGVKARLKGPIEELASLVVFIFAPSLA